MDQEIAGGTGSSEAPVGARLIAAKVKHLPNRPGVYRMYGAKRDVLYVGKARDLKKRVSAYTKLTGHTSRIARMIALTHDMEFVTTQSDVEALLLEANLIKQLKPTYNVELRDDKSFPYITLDRGHAFPKVGKHRGVKRKQVDYFGPFASAGAVNDTLNALLRAFPLRNCTNAMFESRTRPCLQYQIKRCSAPCVGRIDEQAYGRIVDEVAGFLCGRSREIHDRLQAEMEEAAEQLDYERAAVLRDRIKALAHISSKQGINSQSVTDADVIALHSEAGEACIQVFFYRGGRNYGNRAYYPSHTKGVEASEILEAFLTQFYSHRQPAKLILIDQEPAQAPLLCEALSSRAGQKVGLHVPQRGEKRSLVERARLNAEQALARKLAEASSQRGLLEKLGTTLGLATTPERIEVYDNSHIQGRNPVGSFILATPQGFDKTGYRTFKIKRPETAPGDDFAMMREVLSRRFGRLVKEDPERTSGAWPDLLVIDGGKGQVSSVVSILGELGITDLPLVGVAKGPDRNAGRETFHTADGETFQLDPKDPVLYFVQRMRDEAHRFAITTHRNQRRKAVATSVLDEVSGIGAKRKKALLQHFGSAREVKNAGLSDLEQVPGISKGVAQVIYDHFHESR